jgi:hypothetical protein
MAEPQHSEEQQGSGVFVPINWRSAESVPILLANQFLLQYTENNFILSVGQIAPPAIIQLSEENIRSVNELNVVVLDRFVLTPERTRALILLLRRQLRRFFPELSQEIEDEESQE